MINVITICNYVNYVNVNDSVRHRNSLGASCTAVTAAATVAMHCHVFHELCEPVFLSSPAVEVDASLAFLLTNVPLSRPACRREPNLPRTACCRRRRGNQIHNDNKGMTRTKCKLENKKYSYADTYSWPSSYLLVCARHHGVYLQGWQHWSAAPAWSSAAFRARRLSPAPDAWTAARHDGPDARRPAWQDSQHAAAPVSGAGSDMLPSLHGPRVAERRRQRQRHIARHHARVGEQHGAR